MICYHYMDSNQRRQTLRSVRGLDRNNDEESKLQADGGEESRQIQNVGPSGALQSPADQNPAPQKRVKDKKKIQKYESASIDEEEFQDYFTNPIKRKEFDRQRKKQQTREINNINAFTLGDFGIKNMKALRDAMPVYPDEDEPANQQDSQKNYATVALCCLSVTNPFRNSIIQIVMVNPWFDRFILFTIMVNCLVLATDKEVDFITKNVETIDLVFLVIYTCEMIFKVIAMGFCTREHSYLRDPWNKLDFVVVMMGWVSLSLKSGDISAIKVIRILRPLRTINQIPNMSSLVVTILNSMPVMFEVMVLFTFMLIMFGTIATQLLGGKLQKRCIAVDPITGKNSTGLGDDQVEILCNNNEQCKKKQPKGVNSTCQYHGNPIRGTYSFDNILLSIFNIFQAITLEGWTDQMYLVREAENTIAYDIFFVMSVILGSFVILNLMIAVQSNFLDKAFDEEDARTKEAQDKAARKKAMMDNEAAQREEEGELGGEGSNPEGSEDIDEIENDDKNRRQSMRRATQKQKGICNWKTPACCTKISEFLLTITSHQCFEQFVIFLILLNTLFLATEYYNQPDWLTQVHTVGNLFFTIIFAVEMIMKMVAMGIKLYMSEGFNVFDAFIVTMSYVELAMPGENSSLSVLRAFRLLRIFKIVKSWQSLKQLLSTVLESIIAITNLAVLIVLYLFIFALLTKQFFSEPLTTEDGDESRYGFGSTGMAIVSMFIILTGENWNQIMIEVIAQQKNIALPALLFSFIFVIGNFMLLNLFLAILLKAITQQGENEDEELENAQQQTEQVAKELMAEQQKENGEVKTEGNDVKPEVVSPVKEAPKEEPAECCNDSNIINSSNSNIDEEFAQIRDQLLAMSKNLGGLVNGDLTMQNNSKNNQNVSQNNISQNVSQDLAQQSAQIAVEEDDEEKDTNVQGRSCFIFAHDNTFRLFLRSLIMNSYFSGLIYSLIGLNSILLALDAPELKDQFQKKTIHLILTVISIIFVLEAVIKIIVMGFCCEEKSYLSDNWNRLDGTLVMFSFVTWYFELFADGGSSAGFVKGFRALRALRPLRVVSKNEGIKTVVNSLLESIPAMVSVILIVLLFLVVFGILGIQLFKGKMGKCNDSNSTILNKTMCIGNYTSAIRKNGTMMNISLVREWEVPFNNYDNLFISMLTYFEISTLEMWPDMMFAAIDATGIDQSPKKNSNFALVAIVFILYIFVTTFFIMNLFISVIVDKFNEEIRRKQGSNEFTKEQSEWVKIQRMLLQTSPKIIPVEPISRFRKNCFQIVQSQAFEYVVMTAIVINTLFLCIDHYGMSQELTDILDRSNKFFVGFFTLEMILKITAYGIQYYWYVNWNKFDFIVVLFSLVALDEQALSNLGFNVTALRIIRVSRLLRMVKTSEGLRTLLKTLYMSIGNILNTAALLALIIFTFTVAGMSLFGEVPDGEFINENVNFRGFYIAVMTLWRASTGESWNGIMHDCNKKQPLSILFWVVYQLATFFVFMNVFIAVIGDSFNDNQATEDENDILALKKKDIKAFLNTWAKYNPMGQLYMKTDRLPAFLKELPPPLGYQGIRIEDSKLNKIIFCLNIRDHSGTVYYPEVMWTIFHSIAGMNDDKVLTCDQVNNILKVVKMKFKGLGKKVTLDSLCGNKFYRKELTAIKYIQAKKILDKWRTFKQKKQSNAFTSNVVKTQSIVAKQQSLVKDQDIRQNETKNDATRKINDFDIDQTKKIEDVTMKQNMPHRGQMAIQGIKKYAANQLDEEEYIGANDIAPSSRRDLDDYEDMPVTERNPLSNRESRGQQLNRGGDQASKQLGEQGKRRWQRK